MDYITSGDPFFYFLTASAVLKYWAFRGWSNSRPKQARLVGKVTALRIHPVKSMKGFQVNEMDCGFDAPKYGDVADREWVVTTTRPDGVCDALTAKEAPSMYLITTRVEGNHLVLSAPDMDDLKLPIGETTGAVVTSKILGQSVQGLDCGDHAANWIKTFLAKPDGDFRIIHFASSLKKGDLVYGPDRLKQTVKPQDKIIYQDESPVYLVTESSLQEVNDRAQKNLTMDNFRPNIVVGDSGKAYGEDFWEEIFIGDVKFTNYMPCDRCAKTLVDQKLGVMVKDGQPLVAMRKYRMLTPEFHCPVFGRMLLIDRPGKVRVGDSVYATIVDKYIG